jgi:hypothetical protein
MAMAQQAINYLMEDAATAEISPHSAGCGLQSQNLHIQL